MADIEDLLTTRKTFEEVPRNLPVLELITKEISQIHFEDKSQFDKLITTMQRKYHMTIRIADLRYTYNLLRSTGKIDSNPYFEKFCKVRNIREQQGVIVITVVMSPYPDGQIFSCKYDCHYCPNVPEYARSYYPGEPAVERARDNQWDPYKQVHARIQQYIQNGIMLPTAEEMNIQKIQGYKTDFIIEGGTFTSYPETYRRNFIHNLFYACNVFYDQEKRDILPLEEEKRLNETSRVRIIGLSIETRPDTISKRLVKELRTLGVTRVQLGIQHLDDEILRLINRRCYTKHTKRAIKILLDNSFKVAVHYMPDLPGSSSEQDIAMWNQLFNDPDLEFDYCKLYPCMTMPYTEIAEWYKAGEYKPYADETTLIRVNGVEKEVSKVIPVCIEFMKRCKKHQRVERMLRDLPTRVQEAGCDKTNLRQMVQDIMEANGDEIVEIRYREVRNKDVDYSKAKLLWYSYPASGGIEYFIRFESEDEKILLGFIRLRIPDPVKSRCIDELKNAALIREIHVYGQSAGVGVLNNQITQHRGYGTQLLNKAEEIAKEHGYERIAVISGEGVREFYRKRGYIDEQFYMIKRI